MSGIATEDDDMTQDAAAMSAPSAGSTTVPFAPYYQDEAVTIYNADCRKVLPFLERFDLLLTDPPYGIGAGKKGAGRGQVMHVDGPCEWDCHTVDQWTIDECIRAAADACVWGGNYYSLPPCRGMLIWDKKQPMEWYSTSHFEYAWTTIVGNAKAYRKSQAEVHGVMEKVHVTQKPLGLMQWCLGFWPDAATVLDPFMGSGTTLVASKLEGRKAVGIEISEKYCEAAANRLRQGVLF